MIHALLAALLALCIGSLSLTHSQPATASTDVPIGELASLVVVEATPEAVGTLVVGTQAVRRVVLRNVRPVPVRLEITQKSSACLEAAFDSTTLAPDQQTSLTIRAGALPGPGPVRQFAEFRATWEEDGAAHAERAIVELVYRPDTDILVTPEEASIVLPLGARAHFDLWIRYLDVERDAVPPIDSAETSLPGWKVEPVAAEADAQPKVLRFRVAGHGHAVGDHWGEVKFDYADGRTAARVRVMVRVLPPYRAMPGGAAFVSESSWDRPHTRELQLIPRPGVSAPPASIAFLQSSPWVRAALVGQDRVRIDFTPDRETPPVGHARLEVKAQDGSVLLELPVAWWLNTPSIP